MITAREASVRSPERSRADLALSAEARSADLECRKKSLFFLAVNVNMTYFKIGIILIILSIILKIAAKPIYLAEKAALLARRKPRAPAKIANLVKTLAKISLIIGIVLLIASFFIARDNVVKTFRR